MPRVVRPLLMVVIVLAGCGRDWELPQRPTATSGFCDTNADCAHGLCVAGRCDVTVCEVTYDCLFGICVDGSCDQTRCFVAEDCYDEDQICHDATETEAGHCLYHEPPPEGPALLGDPAALRMRDNLETAWDFVRERHPDAELVQITGLALKADGTVDVTADYISRWMYAFREDDQTPPTFVTITYLLLGGETHGLYDPDAGNVSQERAIPEASWRSFLDSPALTDDALARGCDAPLQESSDSLGYSQTEDGPQFIWWNWAGQGLIGDPTSGDVTYDGCDA
jgi:hypothetical protein